MQRFACVNSGIPLVVRAVVQTSCAGNLLARLHGQPSFSAVADVSFWSRYVSRQYSSTSGTSLVTSRIRDETPYMFAATIFPATISRKLRHAGTCTFIDAFARSSHLRTYSSSTGSTVLSPTAFRTLRGSGSKRNARNLGMALICGLASSAALACRASAELSHRPDQPPFDLVQTEIESRFLWDLDVISTKSIQVLRATMRLAKSIYRVLEVRIRVWLLGLGQR
jgi:hypothetical protein